MRTFDGRSSGIYSRSRPTYPAEFYYWLSQQVNSTDVVWDAGCGTGQAAIDLAAYFNRVEASDISESQISEATPHRKVQYQVFPAEKTQYPDNYFDAICVGHALHWFNLDEFWQEVKRVIKPGGLFVCWGYNWLTVGEQEDVVITEHVLPYLSSYWPEQSRLLWNQYHDIHFPFELMAVPTFDLYCNWTMSQTMDFMRTWTASQLRIQEKGDDFLVDANQVLSSVWENPTQKKQVTLPFFVKAGRVK